MPMQQFPTGTGQQQPMAMTQFGSMIPMQQQQGFSQVQTQPQALFQGQQQPFPQNTQFMQHSQQGNFLQGGQYMPPQAQLPQPSIFTQGGQMMPQQAAFMQQMSQNSQMMPQALPQQMFSQMPQPQQQMFAQPPQQAMPQPPP